MVGFVLIVALVMVGLMVFLVISLRGADKDVSSLEAEYMLWSIMKYTTGCAISFEPQFNNFEDLFKSCYQNKMCGNVGISACDYLNESLTLVMGDLLQSEATITAYQLDFFVEDGEEHAGLLNIREGDCVGDVFAAQSQIASGSDNLIVRIRLCKEAD